MIQKWFIRFCLILHVGLAFASTAPQQMWSWDGVNYPFTSPGAACTAMAVARSDSEVSLSGNADDVGNCYLTYTVIKTGQQVGPYRETVTSKLACASTGGGAPDASGQCPDKPKPPEPKCGTPAGGKVSWNQQTGHSASPDAEKGDGAPGAWPTSSPTCGLSGKPSVDSCWSTPASDGGQDFFCKFSGTSNGQNAASGSPSDSGPKSSGSKPSNGVGSADSSGSCPGGTTQGGVDSGGTPICIGSGTNPTGSNGGAPGDAAPTSSTTTKTTNPDGSTTTTTKETTTNKDGSTTTKTTTTNEPAGGSGGTGGTGGGGSTTTTSTSTGLTPDGKQGQPDKPDSDFCKLHPELNICRNSSIAGRCGDISCMGDAIQCATLQQAAALRCAKEDDDKALKDSPLFGLGQNVSSGADPEKDSLPSRANGANVIVPSTLDTAGWLGGGQCFEDRSFSVQGQTITIPFSRACNALLVLRYALMVAASLIAFKTLRSAFLSE